MKNTVALLLAALVASSCAKQASVNLDYSRTNYGYLNSGGHTSGSLLLWDRRKKTVMALENVACMRRTALDPNPVDIETGYEFALDGGGKLTPTELALVRAAVRTRTSLVAGDARRFQCNSIVTSLTKHINSDPTVLSDWFFRDAIENQDLFYVFVMDVTVGDSVEMKVDNEISASAGFPVKVGAASIDVKIDRSTLHKLSGNDVVLMFNVRMLRPAYVKNAEGGQNASFELVRDVDVDALREALRNGR